jgi:hypothetical protein
VVASLPAVAAGKFTVPFGIGIKLIQLPAKGSMLHALTRQQYDFHVRLQTKA